MLEAHSRLPGNGNHTSPVQARQTLPPALQQLHVLLVLVGLLAAQALKCKC